MITHPSVSILALCARNDLGFWQRRRVERHIAHCVDCAAVVSDFQNIRERLAADAQALPRGINEAMWAGMAREMRANIRLGLSAGECVTPRFVPAARPRFALAFAGLAVLVLFACLERPSVHHVAAVDFAAPIEPADLQTLESSASGIEVRASGRTLSLPLGARMSHAAISTVDTRGQLRSRYVDDSGVTVLDVYAE